MQLPAVSDDAVTTYSAHSAEPDLEAVIAKYEKLVSRIAWQVHSRMSSSIDIADLIQIGMVGLVEGARKFEDRGIDFTAYAATRIRGAMIDELRRSAKISRLAMQNRKILSKGRAELTAKLGREPTPIEMAEEMGMDIEEFYNLESDTAPVKQEQLDEVYSDHNMWFADLASNPLDEVERADISKKLARSIDQLPEKQATVLQLYFVEEMNLEEIGGVLNVGAARVCQIKKDALGALKEIWDAG